MRYKDAIEELKRYNDEVQEYLVEFKRSPPFVDNGFVI